MALNRGPIYALAYLLALLAAAVAGFALGWSHTDPPHVAALVPQDQGAVVSITTKHVLGRSIQGTGFIYAPGGYIVTNHHLIEGARSVTVTLAGGRSFPASVVDYLRQEDYLSPQSRTIVDVAIVKINATGLPVLRFGDSNTVRAGQDIVILGRTGPAAQDAIGVHGTVSAKASESLETDAPVDFRSSGGPVLNRSGRVVGLAAYSVDAFGQTRATLIPSNSIRDIAGSATNPRAPRYLRVHVTGMGYLAPIRVGRTQLWQSTYDPGQTRNKASGLRFNTQVTNVQNFSSALIYSIRTGSGGKSTNYLDSHGLYTLGATTDTATTLYPQPALEWPFPIVGGQGWRYTWRSEDSARKTTRQATVDVRIENIDEIIVVPAGKFSHVVRIRYVEQGTRTQNKRTDTWRIVRTEWVAPRIGSIQVVSENILTGERTVSQLLRSF